MDTIPHDLQSKLDEMNIVDGPDYKLQIPYTRWTYQYILSKLLPPEVHPPPTAFEQVGHLAHLNLKPHHEPFRKLIGDVLLDRYGKIECVVNKVGEVSGPYRTYEMELLAGKYETKVDLNENGLKLSLDVAKVYWCSRLSGERRVILDDYIQEGQTIADPFCGVGAMCILAAKEKNCKVLANDWNAEAVEFCDINAAQNGVSHLIKTCAGDAYDFLMDLGLEQQGEKVQLPHHVIMNYPLEAPRFLSALRWWPVYKSGESDLEVPVVPAFHVYTFSRADDDNDEDARDVATVAIDLVAHHLLPEGGATEPSKHRQKELNRLGCDIKAREIRDVAPGKVVMCVTFNATPKLLQHMQGDFV
mmetsp:Transcript_20463/g.31556  ORF Transcript_20463/g.31556 Transcript_20463/m.31556 type:complete len:359 (-) Transcript_20463:3-1079(-)